MNNNLPIFLQGLAQLETAGGRKTIKGANGEDSYNLYNIKDFSKAGTGYAAYDRAEGSRDRYRVYASPDEATADVMSLLQRKYPAALAAQTPQEFAMALKEGGYATDPRYVEKLTNVINSVSGQGKAASTQAVDLSGLAKAGWGDEIKFARQQGIDDRTIFAKISAEQENRQRTEQSKAAVMPQVARTLAAGDGELQALAQLRQAGFDDEIEFARKLGRTEAEIVAKLAPMASQQATAARQQVESDGAVVTGLKSARDSVRGLIRGGKQLVAGISDNDEWTRELQAEEAAERAQLDRVARESTVAGTVGGAAPGIAAAFLPGGAALRGALTYGAAQGALAPTVEGESRLGNAALGAAGGAAGVGLVAGARGIRSAMARPTQAVDDQRLITNYITEQAGLRSDELTPEWVGAAQQALGKRYAALETDLPNGGMVRFAPDELETLTRFANGRALSDQYRNRIRSILDESADEVDGVVTPAGVQRARSIREMRSDIRSDLTTRSDLGADQGRLLRNTADLLDGALRRTYENGGKLGEFDALQGNYQKLFVGESLGGALDKVNGGEITAEKLRSAMIGGGFRDQYQSGRAPFQDVYKAMKQDAESVGFLASAVNGVASNPAVAGAMRVTRNAPGVAVLTRMVEALSSKAKANPRVRALIQDRVSPREQGAMMRMESGAALEGDADLVQRAINKIADRVPGLAAIAALELGSD